MHLANHQHHVSPVALSSGGRRTASLAVAAVIWIATVAAVIGFGGVTSPSGSKPAQAERAAWVSDPAYVTVRSGEQARLWTVPGSVSDPALIEHRRSERDSAAEGK